jgi:hypothetical protein
MATRTDSTAPAYTPDPKDISELADIAIMLAGATDPADHETLRTMAQAIVDRMDMDAQIACAAAKATR